MNAEEIAKKYLNLLAENKVLREENKILRMRLGITEETESHLHNSSENHHALDITALTLQERELPSKNLQKPNTAEKLHLFMSLFRGREDIYAKRWQNQKGQTGYSPVCLNEWKRGFCQNRLS